MLLDNIQAGKIFGQLVKEQIALWLWSTYIRAPASTLLFNGTLPISGTSDRKDGAMLLQPHQSDRLHNGRLAGFLLLSAVCCAAVGAARREAVFAPVLTHWDEAAVYGLVGCGAAAFA
jgi:hypothetical protein